MMDLQAISYSTAVAHKLIRFRDTELKDVFFVADGDQIRITSGYDGSVRSHKCTYIDPHHFSCDSLIFHIDQFAEVMARNNNKYEPESPIADLTYFDKKYYDRELRNEKGELIPYSQVIVQYDPYEYYQERLSISLCPEAAEDRVACIARYDEGVYRRDFLSLSELHTHLFSDLSHQLTDWDRFALDAVITAVEHGLKKPKLESILQEAKQRSKAEIADIAAKDKYDIVNDRDR